MKNIIDKYIERIKVDYPEDDKLQIDLENFAKEIKEQLRMGGVSSSTEFKVWDELFGILAWKYILTKSGDMHLDGEEVYNELKDKFELKRK